MEWITYARRINLETYKIIEKELEFLVSNYRMEYTYDVSLGRKYYRYKNQFGVFTYYEYRQLGEQEFSVLTNNNFTVINMLNEYPSIISRFNRQSRNIRFFLKDRRQEYWKMIAEIIKKEIDSSGTLFGLEVQNISK